MANVKSASHSRFPFPFPRPGRRRFGTVELEATALQASAVGVTCTDRPTGVSLPFGSKSRVTESSKLILEGTQGTPFPANVKVMSNEGLGATPCNRLCEKGSCEAAEQ
eukprot:7225152-Prymnesium_polylepis.2